MIPLRILIPLRSRRGYTMHFESTRQNRAINHKVLEDVAAVLRWAHPRRRSNRASGLQRPSRPTRG